MNNKTQKIVYAALIAAVYATLTIALSFSSFGLVQYRVAEALTVLPFFSAAAIPGLFIGCIISNIISPIGIPDLVFGSLATLIGAILTYLIGKSNLKFKKFLAPIPPIIVNGIVIGTLIKLLYVKDIPLWIAMLQVGFGELVCCYGLGLPLILVIEKNPYFKKIFQ